jgi:AhpD family alkylhydroperoxidase
MSRLPRLEKNQGDARSQQLMADLDANKKLLNIFRGMANSPAVLDGFLKFSGALREGKLPGKTREAIALAVGQANKCDYCLAAHTALGKGAGLDDAAIRDARLGRSSDKKTGGVITLARKLVETRGHVSDSDVAAARSAGLDDGEIAEVVANVVVNIFTNYFNLLNNTEVGTDFPKVPVEIA